MNTDDVPAVGWRVEPRALGEHGYDTDMEFVPEVETKYIEDEEFKEIAESLSNSWIHAIQAIVQDRQLETSLSPKEFAAFIGSMNPKVSEPEIADGLSISIGNARSKIGRARQKFRTANYTLQLRDRLEEGFTQEQEADILSSDYDVQDLYEADEYPIGLAGR